MTTTPESPKVPAGPPPQMSAEEPSPISSSGQGALNSLSLIAFVGSLFISLVGIICGHIALAQIKRTGEKGRGFALAGIIIGYVGAAASLVGVLAIAAALISVNNTAHANFLSSAATAPSPDDCHVATSALATLGGSLSTIASLAETDPATGKNTVDAAAGRFQKATQAITDNTVRHHVDTVSNDLSILGSELNHLKNAAPGNRDATATADDVVSLWDDIGNTVSDCSKETA